MPNLSGWVRQEPDHRDFRFEVSRRITTQLPPSLDLSHNMPPQLDQGDLGSCGPNSADECIMYDEKVQKMTVTGASRLFIYYVTRSIMQGKPVRQDSGVDNRTLLKALSQFGWCKESLWPYDTTKFTKKPSAACYNAALANRIKSYAAVAQNLTQMQGVLVSGFPFLFGFDVFNPMMSDAVAKTGIVPMPAAGDQLDGGHDVTICGYTTVDQPGIVAGNIWPANTFRFRNHWVNEDGTPWGDGGYGYIQFAYATGDHASDFWVINAVPGAANKDPGTVAAGGFSGTLTLQNGVIVNVEPDTASDADE